MPSGLRAASPTSVYLPDHKSTGQVIAFVRDPDSFKVNRYVQMVPTTKPVAVYLYMDPDSPVRLYSRDKYKWPDGSYRPRGTEVDPFVFLDARTERYSYPWTIGLQTIETATWQIKAQKSNSEMTRAMVSRTLEALTLLDAVGVETTNWGTSGTDTANNINGGAGFWDHASSDENDPNYLAIRKTVVGVARRIFLRTNGRVKPRDLKLVVSPRAAERMAQTGEIYNFMKFNDQARKAMRGDEPSVNDMYGVPDVYAGVEVVVEDANYVSTPEDNSGNASAGTNAFIKADDRAVFVTRPGSQDGTYGTQNFSTAQCFYYTGETGGLLKVSSRTDSWNKLEEGAVDEQYKHALVAPISGMLVTSIFSS